jgi:hypothetical protein
MYSGYVFSFAEYSDMTKRLRKKEEGKQVRLVLSDEDHQQLRIAAAKEGKPMAIVVREIVLDYLKRKAIKT